MFAWFIERLIQLSGQISGVSRDRRDLKDSALRAVSHALIETCIYYESLERIGASDPERELQLTRLWAAAAIPIRHFDVDLALACEYKAQYWLDPTDWSEDDIRKHGIELRAVQGRFRRWIVGNPPYAKRRAKISLFCGTGECSLHALEKGLAEGEE